MEKRIVTRGKKGEVIRVVEYYEPHVARERKQRLRIQGWGLVLCVGIVLGFILRQLYVEAMAELRTTTYSRF